MLCSLLETFYKAQEHSLIWSLRVKKLTKGQLGKITPLLV